MLFKNIKSHALHGILLKNSKVQTEKSQKEEIAVKEINTPFTTPIPILIENTFTTFKYSLFNRGYPVYKDKWIPIIRNL